ncbi:phage holin family protein [Natronoglycomyces albus]|uniref:Phage holin family protein n=1 Tax=Natronoglycomyces albus TaxID=2811108 RepID=A0A895XUE3_9ACTN|nr:phage holin family protein [Natronoglycomyces albus]QSB05860.1 phage holin family protein [Natronoglycomyces albus]
MSILLRIAATGVAFWITAALLSGINIEADSAGETIITITVLAVLFGVVNAVLKPIIKIVGCGLYILTLGLFALVVNALLFLLVAWLAGAMNLAFSVDHFGWAMFGALLVSFISWVITLALPGDHTRS